MTIPLKSLAEDVIIEKLIEMGIDANEYTIVWHNAGMDSATYVMSCTVILESKVPKKIDVSVNLVV